jgi:hypothetical protein
MNMQKHNYSPVIKRTFTAPPTLEMQKQAVRVVRNNNTTDKQFLEEIAMLGLMELVPA